MLLSPFLVRATRPSPFLLFQMSKSGLFGRLLPEMSPLVQPFSGTGLVQCPLGFGPFGFAPRDPSLLPQGDQRLRVCRIRGKVWVCVRAKRAYSKALNLTRAAANGRTPGTYNSRLYQNDCSNQQKIYFRKVPAKTWAYPLGVQRHPTGHWKLVLVIGNPFDIPTRIRCMCS